jgi:hypothetical protein
VETEGQVQVFSSSGLDAVIGHPKVTADFQKWKGLWYSLNRRLDEPLGMDVLEMGRITFSMTELESRSPSILAIV